MLSLQNILSNEGAEFMDNLLNKEVIVTEKLNASTLSFKKEHKSEADLNRKLTFYKGSGANKKEITIADRVMTTFYASGMTHINNLSKLIIDRIPANWTFVCKYFPSHQPSFINYSILPKNNLVLSCIITGGGTKIEDSEDLKSWADMFDIAYQEPVFRGYLSEYQKSVLLDYVKDNCNNKDSFSRFIITLLNPNLTHSLYQEDGFDAPIDGFIFKFMSDDGITKPMSAKLIDPYMSQLIAKNKSHKAYKDNTDILLADFTVFMTSQDLDTIVLTNKDKEDRYLELFYRLFNRYIKYKKEQLEDFDVDTNEVVKESLDNEFNIDFDKISNETTKKLLKENPEYKSIFKTLLGSFKTKKPDDFKSVVMSPGVVRLFNKMIDNINNKISSCCDKDNLSFSSYLDTIKHKTLSDLDINNAPANVIKPAPVETPFEVKEPSSPLSFADFKKKEKKETKIEKSIKSIEDMIKELEKNMDNIKSDIKKSEDEASDAKDAAEKAEKAAKESKEEDGGGKDEKKEEKKDEKASNRDEKKDEKASDKDEKTSDKDDKKDDASDSDEDEKDDKKSEDKEKSDKEDKSDDDPLNKL